VFSLTKAKLFKVYVSSAGVLTNFRNLKVKYMMLGHRLIISSEAALDEPM
jgi:hypothetical protein